MANLYQNFIGSIFLYFFHFFLDIHSKIHNLMAINAKFLLDLIFIQFQNKNISWNLVKLLNLKASFMNLYILKFDNSITHVLKKIHNFLKNFNLILNDLHIFRKIMIF